MKNAMQNKNASLTALPANKNRQIPRPFLKWAGGKSSILNHLISYVPQQFHTYYEPFLGGGALFFGLYRLGRIHQATLADINKELIETYQIIQQNVEAVIQLLDQYPYDKVFYYQLREKAPEALPPAERAARMIYLNKTGYNGLYRVNKKGKFNVPFGRYKSPNYKDFDNLRAVSQALQKVTLRIANFEETITSAQKGDFVYFDPPYDPVSETAYFTHYHSNGFGKNDQERLAQTFWDLTAKGVYVMLSNSDTPFIRALYEGAYIQEILAPRFINSKANRRTGHQELLIMNYPPVEAGKLLEPTVAYGSKETS